MKILFAGDTLDRVSGLGYVAISLARRFAEKGHDIVYSTISPEKPISNDLSHYPPHIGKFIKSIPYVRLHDGDPSVNFEKAVKTYKPEIVITVHDPWMLDVISSSPYRDTFTLVNYVTIETPSYPRFFKVVRDGKQTYVNIEKVLSSADVVIPVTPDGMDVLKNMKIKTTDYVYNGLDHIIPSIATRSELFGKVSDDDFVFLTMGVNIYRKQLGRTLLIFSEFLKKVKNPKRYKLVIHTNLASSRGADLVSIIDNLGIKDNIVISGDKSLPVETLHAMYRLSDCYLGLSGGEGFGYGYAEAMYNNLPIIYSDYGCHRTMCSIAGIPVSISDKSYAPFTGILVGVPSIQDAVSTMIRVSSNTKLREKLSHNGKQFSKNLMWDVVFDKFYDTVMNNLNKSIINIPMRRIS